MTKALELVVAGDLPADLDFGPTQAMVAALNQRDDSWRLSGRLNLKLIDDKAMRALNKEYSGKDEPTDVLSFSYIEEQSPLDGELGDIAISLDTAARQAKKAGTSLVEEVATLALHGILHVLGFDHAALDERRAMDNLQADILKQANVTYRDFNWV